MRRVSLGLPLLAMMSLTGPSPTFADVVLPDPLAGYCAGAEQCVHGSVDAPTSTNPPVDFGFTASGGPSTGDLLIDILIPTTLDPGGNYTLTGTLSGKASFGQYDAVCGRCFRARVQSDAFRLPRRGSNSSRSASLVA